MAGQANQQASQLFKTVMPAAQATIGAFQPKIGEQYGFAKGGEDMYNWLLKQGGLLSTDALQQYRSGAVQGLDEARERLRNVGLPTAGYTGAEKSAMMISPEEKAAMMYSPAERQALSVATAAPYAGAFRDAGEQMRLAASHTGSPTSLAPGLAKLAQTRGMSIAPALAGLENTFAGRRQAVEEGTAAQRAGVEQEAAKARIGGEQFGVGAGAGLASQMQDIAKSYMGGQQLETGAAPLFQFPVTAGLQGVQTTQAPITSATGQMFDAYGNALGQATKPGFWSQFGQNLLGNIAKGAGMAAGG